MRSNPNELNRDNITIYSGLFKKFDDHKYNPNGLYNDGIISKEKCHDICHRIIDVFENKKSADLIENIIGDYKIILSEINRSYSKEKHSETWKNDVIYIVKENSNENPIAFKVVDEFQCFLDLLLEVCRCLNYHPSDYMFQEQKSYKNINLTQTIKSFLEKNPNGKTIILYEKRDSEKDKHHDNSLNIINNNYPRGIGNSEMNLNISNFDKTNLHLLENNKNDDNNESKKSLEIDIAKYDEKIAILDEELISVEDNLINKLFKILLYLIFLCVIFVYYLNKFQIQQRFYIDEAVKTQIFQSSFYSMNKYALDNSFSNLADSTDLERWFFDSYTQIFTFSNYLFCHR